MRDLLRRQSARDWAEGAVVSVSVRVGSVAQEQVSESLISLGTAVEDKEEETEGYARVQARPTKGRGESIGVDGLANEPE